MANEYSKFPRNIDSSLQRIFGLIALNGTVLRVSESLHDKIWHVIQNSIPASGVITKREIVKCGGFDSKYTSTALNELIKENRIVRVAHGKYSLSNNPNAKPMKPQQYNFIDDEVFIAWLHENYDGMVIATEQLEYQDCEKIYLVSVLQRYAKNGILRYIDRGLYAFADDNISVHDALTMKYLYGEGHKHIGYYTWQSFEYELGILKEKPTNEYIMSNVRLNNAKRHSLKIYRGDNKILVRSPKCKITDDNYQILPILDFLVKYPDGVSNGLEVAKQYLIGHGFTYQDCEPYLGYYRSVVNMRIKAIFDMQ